jgi:hypothetical protein
LSSFIKIPPDASINIQDAFRSTKDAIADIYRKIDQLSIQKTTENDLFKLQQVVMELAKKPTYRTWEDVFGAFPRVDNLFAPFTISLANVLTGEQVFAQKQFDYRELSIGQNIRGIFWGQTANTVGAKTIRVRVIEGQNNTILAAFQPLINEAGFWILGFRIMRTSQILLRSILVFISGPANTLATKSMNSVVQPSASLNNPLIIQVTQEGIASNDTTVIGGFLPRIEANIETFQTTVGNVGTGEDPLAEKILRTNELVSNGQSLRGIYWGKTLSNTNVKTLRLRIIEGANDTVLVTMAFTLSEVGHWSLGFQMIRVGPTTVRAIGQISSGPSGGIITKSSINVSIITATLANTVTVKLTGEATTTDDITCEGGVIPNVENTISTVQATVGNIGSGEDTLVETILGASGAQFNISADGMTIRGMYWGHAANNANVKTLKLRIIEGANNTVVLSQTLTINESGHWGLGFSLLRKNGTTLSAVAQLGSGPANGGITAAGSNNTDAVATLTNAVTIRITGEATTTDDITVEGGSLSFVP